MHDDAPEFPWNWPAAQLEHAVDAPVAPWNMPWAQLVHEVAPEASEKEPAAQLRHDEAPLLPWYWPAAHDTQADTTSCVPAEHTTAVQALAPESDDSPTAQAAQLDDAVALVTDE